MLFKYFLFKFASNFCDFVFLLLIFAINRCELIVLSQDASEITYECNFSAMTQMGQILYKIARFTAMKSQFDY